MSIVNRWAPAAVLLGVLGIIGYGAAHGGAAKAQSGSTVTVVNASSNPIPVTLQGNNKVYSAQYGTWSVGITNPTSNLDWARNTFQRYQKIYIPNGASSQYYDVDSVYQGKEFVIDNVNASSEHGASADMANDVDVSALSGTSITAMVSMALMPATGTTDLSLGNMQTAMVAHSGETVRVTARRPGTVGYTYVTVFLSGHLVDNP